MGKKNKYKPKEQPEAAPTAPPSATTAGQENAAPTQRTPNTEYKPQEQPGATPTPPSSATTAGQENAAPSQRNPNTGSSGQQQGSTQGQGGGQPGGSAPQQLRQQPTGVGGGQWGGSSQQQQRPQVGSGDGQSQQRPQGGAHQQPRQQGSGGGQQQQRPQGGWGDAQAQQRPQGGGPQQPRQQGSGGGRQQQSPQGGWGDAQAQQRPQGSGPQQPRQQGSGGGQQPQRPQGGRGDGQAQQRPQGGSGSGQPQRSTGAVPKQQPLFRQVSKVSSSGIPRGTLGAPGSVEVNYLKMELSKMPSTAYQYDVVITPDRPKKFMRTVLKQFNEQFFNGVAMAYDGRKSVYTISKLPVAHLEEDVDILDTAGRKMTFKLAIQETDGAEIELNSLNWYQKERIYDKPMRALQCLDVVLSTPCHSKGVRAGRSFYTKPKEFYDLKDGYEMWTGLFQSAILGDEPFLNVDISHKSFPSECTVLDYLKANYRIDNLNQELNPRNADGLRTYLKSITVVYEPPPSFNSFPKSYKVNDLTRQSASRLKFKNDQNVEISVAEYFSSRGYNLRYPHLNCVHVGARDRTNYIPIELLRVPPGQALNKKDGSRQVQQMIRYAATSTDERKTKIMRMLAYFNHNSDDIIRKFGIQIGATFIEVPMRLLKPPYLEYYGGQTILPLNGSWRASEAKFLLTKQPQGKHKWAIIYSSGSRTSVSLLQRLSQMIIRSANKLNMSLQDKPNITCFSRIDDTLREMKAAKYDLVMVVLPFKGTTYAEIKQSAELRHGVLTQCIKEETIERRLDDQLVLNLMLKVNSKLNGTNHKIATNPVVQLKNIMFLGADVTHPAPDQREMPSVVGVSATHDEFGACYNAQYRVQQSTVENIEDMDSIVTHHLNVYYRYQKRFPDQIIYYRDGVSDGQFPIVSRNELTAIRAACTRLRIKPKLTCIIVVKRHHTRFFPNSQPDRFNKYNNVTPGTVVDQVIVHPNEMQFFMVSHQSIQGTAKPTRYNVILDEAKMNIDVIQSLTHYLCHMFPRCNRAVSYPAPAYLAHLVAFRGRVYLEGIQAGYRHRTINENFQQSNPMYFV